MDPALPTEPRGERLVAAALALACAAAAAWVWLVPLSLPYVDEVAAELARKQAPETQGSAEERESEIALAARQIAGEMKARLRYRGDDGREYVYLGDYDSYLWIRNARNELRTGSACDALVDGVCRDTLGMAPVGSEMIYHPSLHTQAVVALHRLLTLFRPGFPLPASAYLVPLLVASFGAFAAFLLGRLLAGNAGGVFAAILISFNPEFLTRSVGSDNDVWNVVLPVCMMGCGVAALCSRRALVQGAFALGAGLFAGLHGTVWSGWVLPYGILAVALLIHLGSEIVRELVVSRSTRVWRAAAVRRAALVLLVFWSSAWLFTALAGRSDAYLDAPKRVIGAILAPWLERPPAPASAGPADLDMWPSTFGTVHELQRPSLADIAARLIDRAAFLGGLVGLLLLALPREVLDRRQRFALYLGVPILVFLVYGAELGRDASIGSLALLFAATFALRFGEDEGRERVSRGAVVVVAAWFLATLFAAFRGLRFVEFVAPPFAFVFAVVAGRAFGWFTEALEARAPRFRRLTRAGVFAALLLFLIAPVQRGYRQAAHYVPMVNDAWWDSLEKLREESAPDAIVNAWWDYGYWIKYVAERRVSHDGGALGTHVPYWIGRAMATPDELESIGILRMLNCGSDATPAVEGHLGAYGKLVDAGLDGLAAHDAIVALARLDRPAAELRLAALGLDEATRASVLVSTHCNPPESYLMLEGGQLYRPAGWLHHGLWDVRRALIARELRFLPPERAVPETVARLGIPEDEARRLLQEASGISSPEQVSDFVAPRVAQLLDRWLPCVRSAEAGPMVCRVGEPIAGPEVTLQTVVYDESEPGKAQLWIRRAFDNTMRPAVPGLVVVAGAERIEEVRPEAPSFPSVALLLDVPHARVLIGASDLLRSMAVKLLYLDDRQWQHFEQFDERLSHIGVPVSTWRIHFDGRTPGRD